MTYPAVGISKLRHRPLWPDAPRSSGVNRPYLLPALVSVSAPSDYAAGGNSGLLTMMESATLASLTPLRCE